jgi:hypothetical protein
MDSMASSPKHAPVVNPEVRMTQDAFRRRLAALIDQFLATGGDPWWLNREVALAGMQAIDNPRCDLGADDDPREREIILTDDAG